jgi:hypothetical protein
MRPRPRRRFLPRPERLDDRVLLSAGSPLDSVPWTALGPAPVVNGSTPGRLPVSGRVTGVAADPADADTLFVAAAGGGVWKTTNATAATPTWVPLTDNVTAGGNPVVEFMGAIAETDATSGPNSGHEIVYAGTGEANNSGDSYAGQGILVSTDGGATWTLQNAGGAFTGRTVSKIAIDPSDPTGNTVYAAVAAFAAGGTRGNTGIWKSTDGGATWTNTTAAAPNNLSTTDEWSDVVIDPHTPTTLYAAEGSFRTDNGFGAGNGVYKSTDGGTTWTLLNGPGTFNGTQDGRIALALFDNGTTQELFVSIAYPINMANVGGQLFKMLRSTDGGASFTDLTATTNIPSYMGQFPHAQGQYDTTLAVDPTNPMYVYAGGSDDAAGPQSPILGNVESFDGGSTWQVIVTDPAGNGPHTDDHAVAFDAAGNLIDGNDGGVFKLTDPTNSATQRWSSLNSNLQITQLNGIALDPTDAAVAWAGTQDNGSDKYTGSPGWTQIVVGDGGITRVDPTNPNAVYQESTAVSLRVSTDGGATFRVITAGIAANPRNGQPIVNAYAPYVLDGAGDVYYGTDFLNGSADQGRRWHQIGVPGTAGFNPTDAPIDAIAVAPSNPTVIYVSAGAKMFVTQNLGAAWTEIDLPGGARAGSPESLAVDPTDPGTAYAVVTSPGSGGSRVFQTTTFGAAWAPKGGGTLPDLPAWSVAVDPQHPATVYVGDDVGVYSSSDLGDATPQWNRVGSGLPNAQATDLQFDTGLGVLAAGTHGRGLWELPLQTSPRTASATALSVNLATVTPGQTFTVLATVGVPAGGPPPTGSVTFLDNGVAFPPVPLIAGRAVLPVFPTTPFGVRAITAVYSGDSNFLPSTSAPVTVTVAVPPGTDLTTPGLVPVSVGKLRRRGKRLQATATVQNTLSVTIPGRLEVTGLPASVKLQGATGVAGGIPFVDLDLGPGQGLSLTLTFVSRKPKRRLGFTPLFFSGE